MIRIFTFLIISSFSLSVFTQCQTLSERDFVAAKRRISMSQGGFNTFQSAMDMTRIYCLTSIQARDIAGFLANDRDKLDFLKQCYVGIVDKENFTDVMDVFRNFSSAFRLYHLTLGSSQINTHPIAQNPNCQRTIDQNSFSQMMRQLSSSSDDRSRASTILSQTPIFCLSIQQIMQSVSTIRDENIRLDVLKRLALFVAESQGYERAGDILSASYKSEFLQFLQNPTQPNPTSPIGCNLTESEFRNFLQSLENQSFDKDKLNHINTHLQSKCLTTEQIKKLVKSSSFDSSKLEIAKALFNNCVDKQNYFRIVDIMDFSSSKNALNDYIKSKM